MIAFCWLDRCEQSHDKFLRPTEASEMHRFSKVFWLIGSRMLCSLGRASAPLQERNRLQQNEKESPDARRRAPFDLHSSGVPITLVGQEARGTPLQRRSKSGAAPLNCRRPVLLSHCGDNTTRHAVRGHQPFGRRQEGDQRAWYVARRQLESRFPHERRVQHTRRTVGYLRNPT
jgi:hypothetical protein